MSRILNQTIFHQFLSQILPKNNILLFSFILSYLVLLESGFARRPLNPSRLEQLTGVKTSNDSKFYWDRKYNKKNYIYGKLPVKFLAENFDYIPKSSSILDLGMGEGRNAVFLARKGHKVTGIDISSVAVKKAKLLSQEYGVKIRTIVGSLDKYRIPKESFDVILIFYFVDRNLTKKIQKWLKPGGIIIFEANTILEYKKNKNSKYSEEFFLKEQELLSMFKGFRLLKYEEPSHEAQFRASAIFQKPLNKN